MGSTDPAGTGSVECTSRSGDALATTALRAASFGILPYWSTKTEMLRRIMATVMIGKCAVRRELSDKGTIKKGGENLILAASPTEVRV
jgi:hypothetical protein